MGAWCPIDAFSLLESGALDGCIDGDDDACFMLGFEMRRRGLRIWFVRVSDTVFVEPSTYSVQIICMGYSLTDPPDPKDDRDAKRQ